MNYVSHMETKPIQKWSYKQNMEKKTYKKEPKESQKTSFYDTK